MARGEVVSRLVAAILGSPAMVLAG